MKDHFIHVDVIVKKTHNAMIILLFFFNRKKNCLSIFCFFRQEKCAIKKCNKFAIFIFQISFF